MCWGSSGKNSNSEVLMFRMAAVGWVCPEAQGVLMSTFTALLHCSFDGWGSERNDLKNHLCTKSE